MSKPHEPPKKFDVNFRTNAPKGHPLRDAQEKHIRAMNPTHVNMVNDLITVPLVNNTSRILHTQLTNVPKEIKWDPRKKNPYFEAMIDDNISKILSNPKVAQLRIAERIQGIMLGTLSEIIEKRSLTVEQALQRFESKINGHWNAEVKRYQQDPKKDNRFQNYVDNLQTHRMIIRFLEDENFRDVFLIPQLKKIAVHLPKKGKE